MKELLEKLDLASVDNYSFVRVLIGGEASASLLYEKSGGEEKVVVKMLIAPRNDTELELFYNEVEALRTLGNHDKQFTPKLLSDINHHNPYPVYYYIMEYIEGLTLKEYIEKKPLPWAWEECIEMLDRIASALSYSSAFLVHRDLHLGNILLTDTIDFDQDRFVYEDPGIRILDFGCNKDLFKDLMGQWYEDRFRHPGAISTWSPEFIINPQAVDRQHDSWALGVLLFRFLTNEYPIHGNCFGDLTAKYQNQDELMSRIDSYGFPKAVNMLLKNLLSFDPNVRFLTGEIGDMCSDILYRNLMEMDEDFLVQYMDYRPSIHQCFRCGHLVGRRHAKCPGCNIVLDEETCLPVLKRK
jgi:serine/threonine protein kinase